MIQLKPNITLGVTTGGRSNASLLKELVESTAPDRDAIVAQFIFGHAALVVDQPDRGKSEPACADAAFSSALHVYRQAVKRNVANRIAFLDELNEYERKGELTKHVEQLVAATQTYVVQVVDSNGMPIADALIEPVSLSINGVPVRTDKQGRATIPKFIGQETKWISVSKSDYQTTHHLELPKVWPMTVTLQPGKAEPRPSSFRSTPR